MGFNNKSEFESYCMKGQETHKIYSKEFSEIHPDFSIGGFYIEEGLEVTITEYAPLLFRNIRSNVITEENFFRSFVPRKNF